MTFQSVFRYFAIFVFALTFGGQKALASDDFCAVGDDKVNIFAKIPVTSAGNLQDYLQTNKQSRIATLEDLLVASESLGSRLIDFQSQNRTAAARAMAERKTWGIGRSVLRPVASPSSAQT